MSSKSLFKRRGYLRADSAVKHLKKTNTDYSSSLICFFVVMMYECVMFYFFSLLCFLLIGEWRLFVLFWVVLTILIYEI